MASFPSRSFSGCVLFLLFAFCVITARPLAANAGPVAANGTATMATPPAVSGTGVRTLYLVRHGIYDSDDPREDAVGKGLIDMGRAQARLIGERLAALPDSLTALYASPFTRARETAEIVERSLPYLHVEIRPEIRECTPPTRRADVMKQLRPEEGDSCRAQLDEAFAWFTRRSPDRDRREVLVCHGNVIRYFVCRALSVDPMAWLGMKLGHASLTVIEVPPTGDIRLLSFGDVGHIPPDLLTYGAKPVSVGSTPSTPSPGR